MNESTESAPRPSLVPAVGAEQLTSPTDEAASSTSEPDRTLLTGIAGELAALTNRAEHASVEAAAIEVQMHDLVDKLTTAAGVTFTDAPAEPSTDSRDAKTPAPVKAA